MSVPHRNAAELGRALSWAPLEQYEPTLTATGSNPSGQTVTGRFRRDGALAFVSGVAVLAATVGTGEYRVSLPTGWTAATITGMYWEGGGVLIDTSASTGYSIKPMISSAGTVIRLAWVNGSAVQQSVTSTSPFTMVATDTLSWHLWLELDTS